MLRADYYSPRSTERPVRKRGDEPRTITTPTKIVRGECSDLPVGQRPKASDESPWYGVYDSPIAFICSPGDLKVHGSLVRAKDEGPNRRSNQVGSGFKNGI